MPCNTSPSCRCSTCCADLTREINAKLDEVRTLYGSQIADILTLIRREAACQATQEVQQYRPFIYPQLPAPHYPSFPHIGDGWKPDWTYRPEYNPVCMGNETHKVELTLNATATTATTTATIPMETYINMTNTGERTI